MKAAFFDNPGPPEVIQYGERPRPEPQSGEVRIRVGAVSINPIDTYIRGGLISGNLPKPFILGCDIAGVIDAVGPGESRFQVGDRVWATNQGLQGRQGTFSEYCCVHEDFLFASPNEIDDASLAAVSLVGITAHLGLFQCAGLRERETVFVNGGTGGVGAMVVQMAKAVGARVITTVGSPAKAEAVRQLGADEAILYKSEDVPARVKELTNGKGVNVYYETLREPDYDRIIDMTAPRGRIVAMAGRAARPPFPHGPFYVKCLTLYGFAMFNIPATEQRACGEDINRWLVEDKLKAIIGQRLPLSQTAEAHRLQEANTLHGAGTLSGKIVLYPDGN